MSSGVVPFSKLWMSPVIPARLGMVGVSGILGSSFTLPPRSKPSPGVDGVGGFDVFGAVAAGSQASCGAVCNDFSLISSLSSCG